MTIIMGANNMNYDFLDHGLPVEPANGEDASREIAKFRKYCAQLGKTASELSEDELNEYYKYT